MSKELDDSDEKDINPSVSPQDNILYFIPKRTPKKEKKYTPLRRTVICQMSGDKYTGKGILPLCSYVTDIPTNFNFIQKDI